MYACVGVGVRGCAHVYVHACSLQMWCCMHCAVFIGVCGVCMGVCGVCGVCGHGMCGCGCVHV